MNQPTLTVCRTCRRTLDITVDPNGISYTHPLSAGPQNHPADPITVAGPADGIGVCDFCSEANPTWLYDCDTFTVAVTTDSGADIGTRTFEGAWSACDTCRTYIDHGRWWSLTRRAIARHDNSAAGLVNILHREFRAHRRGPARPLTGPTTAGS